ADWLIPPGESPESAHMGETDLAAAVPEQAPEVAGIEAPAGESAPQAAEDVDAAAAELAQAFAPPEAAAESEASSAAPSTDAWGEGTAQSSGAPDVEPWAQPVETPWRGTPPVR